jgi:hypothetical protein
MNVLYSFLSGHPDAARELIGQEGDKVPLAAVVELVNARDDFPFALDFATIDRLADPLGPLLAESYLRVNDGERWRELVATARADEPSTGVDWVGFVQPPGDALGIALPDDDDATLRVALFTRVGEGVRRISLDYRTPGQPTGVSMSLGTECSLPDWGKCQTTECGGRCERLRKPDHHDGLVCWCPSQ